jgi:predicted ATPase
MSSIKIKNFGPIVEGFSENDGFLTIDKLMVFIGGQGSGKSSVVKLISTLSWLEKSLFKKSITIDEVIKDDAFQFEWCNYQSIQNYFKDNSHIEYKGDFLDFKYHNKKTEIKLIDNKTYQLPKITYIPAERNFLSVLEDLEDLKGLPQSLSWTLSEFIKACRSQIKPIPIGINNITFEYNKVAKTGYITGDDFENLKLSEASSGIQSVVPMVNVIYYLEHFINSEKLNSIENLSFSEREKFEILEKEIFNNKKLNILNKEKRRKLLKNKFLPNHLFTIIEEIEQNLFPESQKNILNNVLERVNDKADNHLILTTHSPFIIAYLTLALKADNVKNKIGNDTKLKAKLKKIISLSATISSDHTGIYQIIGNGSIVSVKSPSGLVSDDNFLNSYLEDTNELFDELLDIEELCK